MVIRPPLSDLAEQYRLAVADIARRNPWLRYGFWPCAHGEGHSLYIGTVESLPERQDVETSPVHDEAGHVWLIILTKTKPYPVIDREVRALAIDTDNTYVEK